MMKRRKSKFVVKLMETRSSMCSEAKELWKETTAGIVRVLFTHLAQGRTHEISLLKLQHSIHHHKVMMMKILSLSVMRVEVDRVQEPTDKLDRNIHAQEIRCICAIVRETATQTHDKQSIQCDPFRSLSRETCICIQNNSTGSKLEKSHENRKS
ncbi:CLUMA_CG017062, isoform A [Clunio marinus]|uniref:CLUMA_CG017062, isoform A n=1 Tax=Clunio marinus TaxID=568069 RepID=A0A1J1IUP6_9DIPT|nr:CLUMA_CG017062, isoform A [Clunio marinus]